MGSAIFLFDGETNYTSIDDKLHSIADNNAPTILRRETAEIGDDGNIDTIRVTFNKSIDGDTITFVFSEIKNQPSVANKKELDTLFFFSPTLGAAYTGN